jgi:hypothetical protein
MLTNKTKTLLTIALLSLSFFWSGEAQAAISFDQNGKWESSFDGPDWASSDGVQPSSVHGGINWEYETHLPATRIFPDASRSVDSTKGLRTWTIDRETSYRNSPVMKIAFPTPQKELWIRYYLRYQAGFNWNTLYYDKLLYMRTGAANNATCPTFLKDSDRWEISTQASNDSGGRFSTQGTGWMSEIADGNGHSKGEWICLEAYVKMDTGGNDGIGRMWLNGELIISHTNMNFSGNNATALLGWTYIGLNENQDITDNLNGPIGSKEAWVDFDDFVIYNTTPPNADSVGNAFIGPIGIVSEIPGDINKDGIVNIFDYNIFLQHFGVVEDCQNVADLNGDCSVNIFDYNILLQNFGRTLR